MRMDPHPPAAIRNEPQDPRLGRNILQTPVRSNF